MIGIGAFINTILNLVVVGFAVFMLVKGVNKMNRAKELKSPPRGARCRRFAAHRDP